MSLTKSNKWQPRYQHVAIKTDETWRNDLEGLGLDMKMKAEVEAIVEKALENQMPLGLAIQPGSRSKILMPSFTSKRNFGSLALFNSLGSLRGAIKRTAEMYERMNGSKPDWVDESKLRIFRVLRESEVK